MSDDTRQSPVVSVVIPSYKRAASVVGSVESALAQTFRDIEVIVVDDASRDGTADLVRAIDDERVVLFEHERNLGANAARATGIKGASGEWVAFLDSDDAWLPQKLERQLALLEGLGEEYGLCTTWLTIVGPEGEFLKNVEPAVEGDVFEILQCSNPLGSFSSAVIRRETLVRAGGVNVELPACQDWDVFARVSRIAKVCVVREHLLIYRADPRDPRRITTSNEKVVRGLRHMYTNMCEREPDLSRRIRRTGTRYFAEKFANEGAVGDVARVAAGAIGSGQLGEAPFVSHMLLRSIRKAVRAANAAQAEVPRNVSAQGA